MKKQVINLLQNITSCQINDFTVNFPPDRPWVVNSKEEANKFKKQLNHLFDALVEGSRYPGSSYRLHSVESFGVKFAIQSWAGCKDYIHKENKNFEKVKCVINPDGDDDLCFWRCLAIGLYQNDEEKKNYDKIKKRNRNKFQRDEAIRLRNLFYSTKKEYKGIDLLSKENEPPNRIVLNKIEDYENNIIRDICATLSGELSKKIKISIHTLKDMVIDSNTVKAQTTLFSEPPDSIDDANTIHLHYVLIVTKHISMNTLKI